MIFSLPDCALVVPHGRARARQRQLRNLIGETEKVFFSWIGIERQLLFGFQYMREHKSNLAISFNLFFWVVTRSDNELRRRQRDRKVS